MELGLAIKTLVEALKKSKEPGSYYNSWKDNIAVFFMDSMKMDPESANELAEKQLNEFIKKLEEND